MTIIISKEEINKMENIAEKKLIHWKKYNTNQYPHSFVKGKKMWINKIKNIINTKDWKLLW